MSYSGNVKQRLKLNALKIASKFNFRGIECKSAFVFDDLSNSFNCEVYKNILINAEWRNRLYKRHPYFTDRCIYEMQSSNSSDALLMNIFCHPNFIKWKKTKRILRVEKYNDISFGWNPDFNNENPNFKTEIDLKINNDIVIEAKLTESDFNSKKVEIVELYPNFLKVFDTDLLVRKDEKYSNYQLIRNILTAYEYDMDFILLVDETRGDLIRSFYSTLYAVKNNDFCKRLRYITWQELVNLTGVELKKYIYQKYF